MTQKQRQRLIDLIQQELDSRARAAEFETGSGLYDLLEASECLLIQSYDHSVDVSGAGRSSGVICDAAGGSYEYGFVLYWLNNPPQYLEATAKVIAEVLQVISGGLPLPESRITPTLYKAIIDQIATEGIVAEDGTIYGDGKYEQLDPGWFFSLLYFAYYQIRPDQVHPFNSEPAPGTIPLSGAIEGQVSIAILGDWGTGEYGSNGGPAIAVIDAIRSLDTDYIVHLGDVYYAGTRGIVSAHGEESENLMDVWPPERFRDGGRPDTCFTLNSNHEMYDGANGYFDVALSSVNTPFNLQQRASFFALEYDCWTIVGFDSAWYSSPDNLFMDGTLGGSDSTQVQWCRENFGSKKGKNVIVLTHHNGIAFDGTLREKALWDDVTKAVNGVPEAWYWGHVHLSVVYGDGLPTADGAKVRCCGNAAIPNAMPWGLEGKPHIDYYPQTKVGKGLRVRNGFAVITLHAATPATPAWLEEAFYEVEDGTSKPILMWSSPAVVS